MTYGSNRSITKYTVKSNEAKEGYHSILTEEGESLVNTISALAPITGSAYYEPKE